MRYVGLLPNTVRNRFAPEAAAGLVGKRVPFRAPDGAMPDATATVVSARVDEVGLHLEFQVEGDGDTAEKLANLLLYGNPHGREERIAVAPSFSIGRRKVTGEIDPLLRVGCVQPSSVLDTHENRDAMREIVKAAMRRYEEGRDGSVGT